MSYEDSYYRTLHGIISGKAVSPSHEIDLKTKYINEAPVKNTLATYVISTDGNVLGYFTNDRDNNSMPIWKCGAYVALDEVCAFTLAFGEVPCNNNYHKNDGTKESIAKWGIYGRVNIDSFSGDTSRYPYEPELPFISGIYPNGINYTETDFGTFDTYYNGTRKQTAYNDGYKINRGAGRIVFVSDKTIKKIDERYVFYTHNHYNDFQEYLNYTGGFGERFGFETAGNPYCGGKSDYLKMDNPKAPTLYPTPTLVDQKVFNSL